MDFVLEKSWKELLVNEFNQPYFKNLERKLEREYENYPEEIFPEKDEVFKALNLCPPDQVRVVILGQDPYPTKGHAHGLSFSVAESVRPLPKSLVNIFKELESDLGQKGPLHGNLENWAKQGVLLLNAVLTVKEGQADSHSKFGWEEFTDAIIRLLNEKRSGIVYLLWGAKAQKKGRIIDAESNLVLKSAHPSPLSSYRGFFGSKPFSKTNFYLESMGQKPIIW